MDLRRRGWEWDGCGESEGSECKLTAVGANYDDSKKGKKGKKSTPTLRVLVPLNFSAVVAPVSSPHLGTGGMNYWTITCNVGECVHESSAESLGRGDKFDFGQNSPIKSGGKPSRRSGRIR